MHFFSVVSLMHVEHKNVNSDNFNISLQSLHTPVFLVVCQCRIPD